MRRFLAAIAALLVAAPATAQTPATRWPVEEANYEIARFRFHGRS